MILPILEPELYAKLKQLATDIRVCGSRITCNPMPEDADEDWLILAGGDSSCSQITDALTLAQFDLSSTGKHYQEQAEESFSCWKRRDIDILLTKNITWHKRHVSATHVCKKLNILYKPHRIMLFQAVLYGNIWNEKNSDLEAEVAIPLSRPGF